MLTWGIEGLAQGAIVQLIWQAARLGTATAIGGTATHQRRHETLARIANAQGTMGKRLKFNTKLFRKLMQTGNFG